MLRLLLVAGGEVGVVGEEVIEVKVEVVDLEREGFGVVTSQMIVVKSAGTGGREKPAFKDIAICIKGL